MIFDFGLNNLFTVIWHFMQALFLVLTKWDLVNEIEEFNGQQYFKNDVIIHFCF